MPYFENILVTLPENVDYEISLNLNYTKKKNVNKYEKWY